MGPMAKSAQVPMHIWLPDAMAGPTPVSALIHAATMVAAGVYFMARVSFLLAPEVLQFIAISGAGMAALAGLCALAQTDIKKSLAYSTLAHLGIMAVPTNVYAGIAKYPLLAIPMFVLAGAIFDKAGVAGRLLRFMEAIVGRGRGSLAVITILVAMIIGGISGSGPACTAAVGGVMLNAMLRAGYDVRISAGVITAGGCLGILIPPSIMLIVYGAMASLSVVKLYAAAMIPGLMLAGMYVFSTGLAILASVVIGNTGLRDARESALLELPPLAVDTLQVNVTKLCNQVCASLGTSLTRVNRSLWIMLLVCQIYLPDCNCQKTSNECTSEIETARMAKIIILSRRMPTYLTLYRII